MQKAIIKVFDSHEALYDQAAGFLLAAGRDAAAKRGRFLLALSGGGTPRPLHRKLARSPYRDDPIWRRTHFFWGDERLVPPDDEGSNYGMAKQDLLEQIEAPPENIHRVRGELSLHEAAETYAAQLAAYSEDDLAWPRFDLIILGMGHDGHFASIFPAAKELVYDGPVIGASALYEGRPAARVSLTPPVFNSARRILFIVVGAGKAEAVAATLEGQKEPLRWPAQRLDPHAGVVTWFLDRPAAANLTINGG